MIHSWIEGIRSGLLRGQELRTAGFGRCRARLFGVQSRKRVGNRPWKRFGKSRNSRGATQKREKGKKETSGRSRWRLGAEGYGGRAAIAVQLSRELEWRAAPWKSGHATERRLCWKLGRRKTKAWNRARKTLGAEISGALRASGIW